MPWTFIEGDEANHVRTGIERRIEHVETRQTADLDQHLGTLVLSLLPKRQRSRQDTS
jgi:hypothetical protein